MRVVSLLASGTEIVCALGMGEALVGRSHECDSPSWVKGLPSCSAPTFDVTMSSAEIDREVSRRMRACEPLYLIDNELILELKADLLIAQEHCEVCAITPGNVRESGSAIPAEQVMALTSGSMTGIYEGIVQVARALGVEERGHELVRVEKARLAAVAERCAGKRAPTVVMVEWTAPIYAMANWGPELVDAANGRLLIGNRGQHSAAIGWEAVQTADPEVLVVAPCGYDLKRTLAERAVLEALPGWGEMRAVRAGRVAYADGNLYFNRSGMTVTRTAEILAEMLHGEMFGERSEGDAWCWA